MWAAVMFLLILSEERFSSNTSAHTQNMTSSRTSTGERKNELCSSHQSGKRSDKRAPFLGSRPSRHDYEDALTLVKMLTTKIDKYENKSPVFAKFNARVASIPSGVALLRTLMDQYQR